MAESAGAPAFFVAGPGTEPPAKLYEMSGKNLTSGAKKTPIGGYPGKVRKYKFLGKSKNQCLTLLVPYLARRFEKML